MGFISNIFSYLKQHPEVTWSGIGTTVLLAVLGFIIRWFIKNYKIVKANEYVDVEKIKKVLKFDNETGIFYKITDESAKEMFCPRCLEGDKKLSHLIKEKYSDGKLFKCVVCKQSFGNGFLTAKRPKNEYDDFIKYNG